MDKPIGETYTITEFEFFSLRWNKDDGVYSSYTTRGSFLGFKVEGGYTIKYWFNYLLNWCNESIGIIIGDRHEEKIIYHINYECCNFRLYFKKGN